MRIVSGSLKGRRIIAPKGLPARPTTDYAKESLFNILQHEIDWPQTRVVDLFCGIGSISLEALSRGASIVWSVDAHGGTTRWLQKTIQDLGVADRSAVVRSDALKWLSGNTVDAELIFADPPYDFPNYEELITAILDHPGFNEGLFVLEHRKDISFQEHPNFADERTYGEVRFTFLRA